MVVATCFEEVREGIVAWECKWDSGRRDTAIEKGDHTVVARREEDRENRLIECAQVLPFQRRCKPFSGRARAEVLPDRKSVV